MASTDYSTLGGSAHPYLHEPRIYITGLPAYVSDANLAIAFQFCAPFRPTIPRDGTSMSLSGTIEFRSLDKAEKALATLAGRTIPELPSQVPLILSPYPPTSPPTALPPPNAQPRLVKHLPSDIGDSDLFDIFRPYGALASVRASSAFGPDTGIVEFWREEDARNAEDALHCADIGGSNIAVQAYQPRRTSGNQAHQQQLHALAPQVPEFNIAAPSFVPAGGLYGFMPSLPSPPPPVQHYSPSPPPRGSPYLRPTNVFVHGPGQQVQPAAPGTSHSGLIDPCNLFCKNLDPEIDSNSLFSHFRHYGQIVSARVMRNESGESRGFGFVSYQTPEQANAALKAMNGAVLGSKAIVVRLHEPKQMRQEKLALRFQGSNGHPRSASGAASPTHSDGDESFGGFSPRRRPSSVLGSPQPHQKSVTPERPERARRGSGSYYQAALAGNLNLPMQYDDLSALSPVVRKEVLTGELSRRVRTLENPVPAADVDAVVETLVSLSLTEVVQAIHDSSKFAEQVSAAQRAIAADPKPKDGKAGSKSPSPANSQDSRLLDSGTLNATASAPEHPSTPVSLTAPLATPPRTASPAGSIGLPPPTAPERERMSAAIARLEGVQREELTDLLMSLPKRERAMCLFNVEVLRAKIADAKAVLDVGDDEEDAADAAAVPVTPIARRTTTALKEGTPELSRVPSAPASPMPSTPSQPAQQTYTIEVLAKLPANEVIRIARAPNAAGLPLPKADPKTVEDTDAFVDGLGGKTVQQQKQALGDKLFRVIKGFGVKGAPKLTIALLDQEDLRSLAHLMNSYPAVLKEKVLLVQATIAAK